MEIIYLSMLAKSHFGTSSEDFSSDDVRVRVFNALDALPPTTLQWLKRYAQSRMFLLGDFAAGREHNDLYHEALVSTLTGKRRWDHEKVPFERHLMGAMKSISYAWAQKRKSEVRLPPPEETNEDGDKALAHLYNIPDPKPHPVTQLEAREIVQAIWELFRDDRQALKMLTALMDGQRRPEVMTSLWITEKEYYTVRKRIRRKVQNFMAAKSESRKQKSAVGEVP